MKKITEEWVNAGRDDLRAVARVLEDPSLTHIASFHCQQAVEKGFKALMEEHAVDIPKIHKLVTLFEKIRHLFASPVDIELLKVLDELYLDARYPGNLGLLPDGKPSIDDARRYMDFASWIIDEIQRLLK